MGNEAHLKEEEAYNLLKNEDFQKQFICDSLINKKNIKTNVTEAQVGGDWENGNTASKLTIDYLVGITYKYDQLKEPAIFTIGFDSQNVGISISTTSNRGDYYNQPSNEDHYNAIRWSDIDVSIFSIDGDTIPFIAFQKAPIKIQELFIREYTEDFIANETADTDRLRKDNVRSIPYC